MAWKNLGEDLSELFDDFANAHETSAKYKRDGLRIINTSRHEERRFVAGRREHALSRLPPCPRCGKSIVNRPDRGSKYPTYCSVTCRGNTNQERYRKQNRALGLCGRCPEHSGKRALCEYHNKQMRGHNDRYRAEARAKKIAAGTYRKKPLGPYKYVPDKRGIVGTTVHMLTFVKETGFNKHHKRLYEAKCACGKSKVVVGGDVLSGRIRSCGCHKSAGAAARAIIRNRAMAAKRKQPVNEQGQRNETIESNTQ
jgi:hypothetical protein